MGKTTIDAVINFTPLIRKIASKLAAKLPPGTSMDDLMQDGMIGLMNAVRNCKVKDERFTVYAYQRIQGAMLDSLRDFDIAPRDVRKRARQANSVVVALEHRLGRKPFESEIAAELGVALSDYQRLLFDVYSYNLLYFDPHDTEFDEVFGIIDTYADPTVLLENQRLIRALEASVAALPERHRRIIGEIYFEGRAARDILAELGLTESRVSQIRREALDIVRAELLAGRHAAG